MVSESEIWYKENCPLSLQKGLTFNNKRTNKYWENVLKRYKSLQEIEGWRPMDVIIELEKHNYRIGNLDEKRKKTILETMKNNPSYRKDCLKAISRGRKKITAIEEAKYAMKILIDTNLEVKDLGSNLQNSLTKLYNKDYLLLDQSIDDDDRKLNKKLINFFDSK